jgi:cytochrome c
MTRTFVFLAALASLAGWTGIAVAGGGDQPGAAPAASKAPFLAAASAAAPPPAPPAAFAVCATCHSVKKGERSGFGPNLYGVAGSRAGAVAGYGFSPAMKNSKVIWNRDALDRFIGAPQTVVPGTKMAFPGVKDAAKRKAIVDYLMALK